MRLLDANVFITASNIHYPFSVFPIFWDWLDGCAARQQLASTDLVLDELLDQDDELSQWARERKQSMFYVSSAGESVGAEVEEIGRWINSVGFAAHVQADFMRGADPFLAAVAKERGDTVVTLETLASTSARRKVHLPNVCKHLGVSYETTYDMLRRLNARF